MSSGRTSNTISSRASLSVEKIKILDHADICKECVSVLFGCSEEVHYDIDSVSKSQQL